MIGAAVPRRLALATQQQFFLRDATKPTRGCRCFAAAAPWRRQRQLSNRLRFVCHADQHLSRKAPTLGPVRRPEEKLKVLLKINHYNLPLK